jgi:REP element-mobilizing transposase RayT
MRALQFGLDRRRARGAPARGEDEWRGERLQGICSRGELEVAQSATLCSRSMGGSKGERTFSRREFGAWGIEDFCPFKCNRWRARSSSQRRQGMSKRDQTMDRSGKKDAKPSQGSFAFPHGWGGRRRGSGRKPRGGRAGVPHRARAPLAARFPAQVTMRVRPGLPSLRGLREYAALRRAIADGCERGGFRLVHYSVQSNHLHLIVEGRCRSVLSRGLQGLAIRMARALNRSWRRVGSVFADRYHDRILRSPSEVWNALRYVLCNARKHRAWSSRTRPDPFSSAPWFDGWRELEPELDAPAPTARARTWLLDVGWRMLGLLSVGAAPMTAGGPRWSSRPKRT